MNRLQKKCLIGSVALHGFLLLILLVGPAFLSPNKPMDDLQVIEFIPDLLVDENVSGGGNPNAGAQPPPPQPKPEVKPEPRPEVKPDPPSPKVEPKIEPKADPKPEPKEVVTKEEKIDPDSLETAKPKLPKVNTKVYSAPKQTTINSKAKAAESARKAELQRIDEARRLLAQSAGKVRPSSATTIESYGPGGGGPTYANYAAWVKTVYENAWLPPEETDSDDAITVVTVTIARDGKVLEARITRRSGDTAVDNSVQRTLERVTTIGRPFPEGATERQRSYIINFNLKAKRGLA